MKERVLTKTKTKALCYNDIAKLEGPREFLQSIAIRSKQTVVGYTAGLLCFSKYLSVEQKYNLTTILNALKTNKVDVYTLLNGFVLHLMNAKHRKYGTPLTQYTRTGYMVAVRSYLQYNDVDIIPHKFKRKVMMPKIQKEDEEALDAADIRQILLSCSNRRLKPYLLVLASAGLRASEALAMRLCDIDFSTSPVKIHVRKEYAKTRVARDVYISDEAAKFLREWLDWKYRKRAAGCQWADNPPVRRDTDLVFAFFRVVTDPRSMYHKVRQEFAAVLEAIGQSKYKEGMQRRTITLHSFRRYVKTVISDQVSKDYSEWFLGHSKSPYYTLNEKRRREHYKEKCMKYLTFLDYTALENMGASVESKLEESQKEIEQLKKQISELKNREDEVIKQTQDHALAHMQNMFDQKIAGIMAKIQEQTKELQVLKKVKERKMDN